MSFSRWQKLIASENRERGAGGRSGRGDRCSRRRTAASRNALQSLPAPDCRGSRYRICRNGGCPSRAPCAKCADPMLRTAVRTGCRWCAAGSACCRSRSGRSWTRRTPRTDRAPRAVIERVADVELGGQVVLSRLPPARSVHGRTPASCPSASRACDAQIGPARTDVQLRCLHVCLVTACRVEHVARRSGCL